MSNKGIGQASLQTVVSAASRELLSNVNAPFGVNIPKVKDSIESLTKFETKCLLVQLGNIESNTDTNLIGVGVPPIGTFKAHINSGSLTPTTYSSFGNVATVKLLTADHSDIKLGYVANVVTSASTGRFGSNTMVIQKSIAGNTTAGSFVPGFEYVITSIGTTDFSLIGVDTDTANVVIGNVFVANAVGLGTGTASISNNQIMLSSSHTVTGDVIFNANPLSLGKYQNSDYFLIKNGYKNDDGTWTGKDGVDSHEVFLAATTVQDNIVQNFIQQEYNNLIKSGAIRDGDTKEIIAGMLALAYQYQDLGNPLLRQSIYNPDGTINLETYSIATKANVWRETGQTVDSKGRPGHIYFNGGRYAITTLGADVSE